MLKRTFLLILLSCSSIALFSQAPCPSGSTEVRIEIVPDNFPTETTWELKSVGTNVLLASGGSVGDTLCVPTQTCLDFTIYDSFGDGICCNYGQGSYAVYFDGVLSANGGAFGYDETTILGNCAPGINCEFADSVTEGQYTAAHRDYWYSFTPDSSGQYKISTCGLSNCDTKIWVYDVCQGLQWDNSNQATIYYNDDLCGLQSEVTALFQAGLEYYIRIGDKNSSCSATIGWELSYDGPVVGCTDPNACNYNPLATVSDTCYYPGNPLCPDGPDLTVVESAIVNSFHVDSTSNNDACAVAEGCLAGYGMRKILRFTTHIKNIGNQDYYIGSPTSAPTQFTYDNCHSHWHYVGYAEYVLYDSAGVALPIGFKNGFCVMDLECSGGGSFTYGCNNMGITAGCGDIYGSGLSCQWIDISNVGAGRYTLVVRVNWDRSPDALGRLETDWNNNHASVCFDLSWNGQTPVANLVNTCPPIIDCLGNPFGNAVLDCNGVCNGGAVEGDLNNNQQRETFDSEEYVDQILVNGLSASNCTDLNADGDIDVFDPALLNSCILFGGNHQHTGGGAGHDHCEFPSGVTNIFDSVYYRINNIDYNNQYVDIEVRNPHNHLLAYQFAMHGLNVSSVQNLAPVGDYPISPKFNSSGTVIGISHIDSSYDKSLSWQPLVRIYYSATTDSVICIDEVVSTVNEHYEETMSIRDPACFAAVLVSREAMTSGPDISVHPNPFSDYTILVLNEGQLSGSRLLLYDLSGKVHRIYKDLSGSQLRIDRGNLSPGIYLYRLEGKLKSSGKILIH